MHVREIERIETKSVTSRTLILVAVIPCVVLLVVVLALILAAGAPAVVMLPLVAAISGAWAWSVSRSTSAAEDFCVAMFGADVADDVQYARLHNVTEGLCLSLGMNKPRLMVFTHDAPIAAVAAQSGSAGTILVADGFARTMDRMEHEAVVAHLLSRLRAGDVAARCGWLALDAFLSRIGGRGLSALLATRMRPSMSLASADDAAVKVTRYPPALVSALEKSREWEGSIDDRLSRASTLFFFADGWGADADQPQVPNLGGSSSDADHRIELLKEA